MKHSKNEERSNRLKNIAYGATAITLGAFALKESGNLKYVSKAFEDIEKTFNKVSEEFSNKAFKELDYTALKGIAKRNILNEDSIWKMARNNEDIELDYSKGLFSSLLQYNKLKNGNAHLKDEMFDAHLKNEVINNFNKNIGKESKEFFEELTKLVDESLNNQGSYFESKVDNYKAIKEEFDNRLNGSILEKRKEDIVNIMEQAINNAEDLRIDFEAKYNDEIKNKLLKTYKEEMINKYSKDGNKDFFETTLDRAATVKDFLQERAKDNISIKNEQIFELGENSSIYDLLKDLTDEDARFNDLIIDKTTLRVDKNEKIYSSKPISDLKYKINEELADTIPGKLFYMRSFVDIKKSPDFFYLPQGSYDPIIGKLTGSETGLLKQDFFKIGNKFFGLNNNSLEHIKDADNLYLMSGRHGALNVINNRMQGNFNLKEQKVKALKYFDINTTGVNVIEDIKGVFGKFDDNSKWIRNSYDRIFDFQNYNNIDKEKARIFYQDINQVNSLFNHRTFAPSKNAIEELKKVSTSSTKKFLNSLDNDNIAEYLLKNNYENFHNKNLKTLLNKYKKNISSIGTMAQIGNLGEKNGLNILKYNDLLKREIIKEALLKDSIKNSVNGYSITFGKLNKLNLNNNEKNNIKNIFNWGITQKETETFSSMSHYIEDEYKKPILMKSFGNILKGSSKNAQTNNFLEEYRRGLQSFIYNNSSLKTKILKEDNSIKKGYKNNDWVTMRKSTSPLDIIKNLNNSEKNKATINKFLKQMYAGRNNTNDVTTLSFLPYHLLNRLTTPMEKFGLGFSKDSTSSVGALAKNIGLKRILPIIGISTALSYLNFESENLTGTSLSQDFLNFKANFGVGTKVIQQGLGLDDNLRRSRMYNPITNYWLGEYKDKDEYLDYLENGYDPIRKGRWWNFGSASEFRGGKISYWEPNKIRQSYSHYKDISLYGSTDEKWKHSWIPTPRHPLSPIRNLLNPYWLENKHYWDRPYPVTGSLFAEETPWGAVLNPTIGQILKPKRKMHTAELQGTMLDVRSIIAKKNEEIKERADENRLVRVDQSGFTPMEYSPESMPSLNEAIYTINFNRGKIVSAGFDGQQYTSNMTTVNNTLVPDSKEGKIPGQLQITLNKLEKDNNSKNLSNLIISGLSSIVTSQAFGGSTSLKLIANINQGIKNKTFDSNEYDSKGVIKEKGRLHTSPYLKETENAKDLYLNKLNIQNINSKNEYVSNLLYSTKELSGMYGFLFDSILPSSHGYELEQAGKMNSFVRSFWDESFGGWGSDFMEITRRFFPHENHNIEQINPIRNTMPLWLPDRYQTGDPYTKVTKGEARLPGAGYEALNTLHPDKYGRYGAFDRYKILADVSPGSDEYKTWKKISKQEVSNPKLKKEMEQIEKRAKEQTKDHSFYDYKFLGKKMKTQKVVINEVSNTGSFKIIGSDEQYSLAGVKPLQDENKRSYIHDFLKPGMIVTLQYENNDFRNRDKTGAINTIVKFKNESISKEMWEEKKAKEKENKETLADELFAAGNGNMLFGSMWELIGHAQIPYFHNKFLKIDSPLESYKKEQVYGTNYSTWDHPIKGFIKPTFQNAWAQGPIKQGLGLATWMLSNKAIRDDWKGASKTLAHGAFALTNPGALAGGIIGAIPRMNWGSKTSHWNSKNGANIGAAIGIIGYGFANLDNPFLSSANFAAAGMTIANQLKIPLKNGKTFSGKEGAMAGAIVGLSLSALKNPEFSLNKLTEKYIPKDTKKKWEVEEYFDRLEYLKYTNLYHKAAKKAKKEEKIDIEKIVNKYEYTRKKNEKKISILEKQKIKAQKYLSDDNVKNQLVSMLDYEIYRLQVPEQYYSLGKYTKAALAYKKAADTTIFGLNKDSTTADVLRALPKYDRDYFLEFTKEKDPKARKKILKMVSPYKQKALNVLWGEKYKEEKSNKNFFSRHNLPSLFWSGWNPNVNLDHVKMKTIENEGMLLSDFGIYESQKYEPAAQNAPEITNMNSSPSPLALQRDLLGLLKGAGLQHVDVSVETSSSNGIQIISNISRVAGYDIKQKVQNTLYNIF